MLLMTYASPSCSPSPKVSASRAGIARMAVRGGCVAATANGAQRTEKARTSLERISVSARAAGANEQNWSDEWEIVHHYVLNANCVVDEPGGESRWNDRPWLCQITACRPYRM